MELKIDDALRRGIAAHRAGKLQEADRYYTAVLKVQPKHPDASHNLGILAVTVGKLEQAVPLFKNAVEVNSSFGQYWISYINTLVKLNQIDQAQSALAEADRNGIPGDAFDQCKEFISERKAMHSGSKSQDKDPLSHQLQPTIELYDQGEMQQALVMTEHLLQKFPDSLVVLNIRAACFTQLDQLDEAIELFRKIISLNPNQGDTHNNLGVALKKTGDIDDAINSFRQALKIDVNDARTYFNLGNTLREKGDFDEAICCFRQAVEIKPDYSKAYNNLGVTLKEDGNYDGAIYSYKQALKVDSDFAEAHKNMGIVLREQGNLDTSIFHFRRALKIKPDFAQAYMSLGVALQDKRNLDDAIDSYRQAIAFKSDYAEAFSNLGTALKERGDLAMAIHSHRQAIKISPDFAEAHSNLGVALLDKGDLHGALRSYNQAIQIRPDNRAVWSNIIFPLRATQAEGIPLEDQLPLLKEKYVPHAVRIQAALLKYKLTRGTGTADVSLTNAIKLLAMADNISIENPEQNNVRTLALQSLPQNNVVALLHFGSSGSGLLHSLLDGHSQVSTLPSIYFSEFFDATAWERITVGGWHEIPDRFVSAYRVLFDATAPAPVPSSGGKQIFSMGVTEGMTRVGAQKNEALIVDRGVFCGELRRLMTYYDRLDAWSFFQLVHRAYEKALRNNDEKCIIFYHIHNPDTYAKLNFIRAVPQAKWVMVVREPVQSCESWVKASLGDKNYSTTANQIITMLFQIDDVIFRNYKSIGLRLEDLKERPKETLRALCDWMGIDEEDSLYEMTAQGQKWWGDPSSPDYASEAMQPFGRSSITRKVGSIFSEQDQFILRTLFYPFSVKFGYEEANLKQFKQDLQTIRPLINEMFDFEKVFLQSESSDEKRFCQSGSYLDLRCCMLDRWNILNEFHAYPDLLEPLQI